MKSFRNIKSLVRGDVPKNVVAEQVDNLISKYDKLVGNIKGLISVLEVLRDNGVMMVISADVRGCCVKIFDFDMLNLIKKGFSYELKGNTVFVSINGIKVYSFLRDEHVSVLNNFSQSFRFWYSDLVAYDFYSFINCLEAAPLESVQHHFYNGDFSKWLKRFVNEKTINDIEGLKSNDLTGLQLKECLLRVLKGVLVD